MGNLCVGSSELRQETEANRKVSKEQFSAKQKAEQSVKLLLLGTGDSGKTTWRKQISNVYCHSFSTSAVRREMSHVIVGNLIQGCQAIAKAGEELNLPITDSDALNAMGVVDAADQNAPFLTQECADAINKLWKNEQFRAIFDKRSSFQLQDCWRAFVNECAEFPKWGGPEWTPTVEDCVRARVRTSGIIEEDFDYRGVRFRLFDAGGQRAERRKWIHCFDAVTAVIFVAASSEYDQTLFEDSKTNRLVEAITLFGETINSKWFSSTPFILFLNKRDLFEEKFMVRKVPINISGEFPTAPEDHTNLQAALDWMSNLFLEKRQQADRVIYVHHTTATDPRNVEAVFTDCCSIILRENLHASGLS